MGVGWGKSSKRHLMLLCIICLEMMSQYPGPGGLTVGFSSPCIPVLSGTPAPLFLMLKAKGELIGKATYIHFISFYLQELLKK